MSKFILPRIPTPPQTTKVHPWGHGRNFMFLPCESGHPGTWRRNEIPWSFCDFPFRNEEFLVYPSLKLNSSLLKIGRDPKFKVIFQLSTQPSIFKCCFLFQGAYQFYDPNLWIVAIRVKVPMQSKPPSIMAPGRPRLVWTRAHAGCHKSQGTAWGKTNTPCP